MPPGLEAKTWEPRHGLCLHRTAQDPCWTLHAEGAALGMYVHTGEPSERSTVLLARGLIPVVSTHQDIIAEHAR